MNVSVIFNGILITKRNLFIVVWYIYWIIMADNIKLLNDEDIRLYKSKKIT